MPTPSIQTLVTDAQQVLNLDSISAVRSVVAVALANANTGTPLNPNLTTQQLWNEFYQVVTKPKSDIESIIANQLMKFLYAPPAPNGVAGNKRVIFNDNGVLATDKDFTYDKATDTLYVDGSATIASATITGDLTVDTSTLKVDSTNNRVGVNTASPTTTLDVNGVANFKDAVVHTIGGQPIFARVGAANTFLYAGTTSLSIRNNADTTTFVSLDGSGNLGLGVTPLYPFHMLGELGLQEANPAGTGTKLRFIGDATKYNFRLGKQLTATNTFEITPSTAAGGTTFSNPVYTVSEVGLHKWYNGVTQAMTLDASGNLLVGVTSANANGGVLQLKSGITFPATQVASSDANTLDDYEEGTWTPAISGTTAAGSGTYSNQIGRYTKVGNQVTVVVRLSWSAHTGTGDMLIAGFPFALANVNNLGAGAAIGYTANIALTAGNLLMIYGDPGNSKAYFWQTPTGGGAANTVAIDTAGDVGFTMTYFV